MMIIPKRNNYNIIDDIFGLNPLINNFDNRVMRTDIKETENEYLILIDLPGYSKEDIKINIEDSYLYVEAYLNLEENNDNYLRKERYYGQCSRSFYIGEGITEEEIKASFKNGILKIIIPKKNIKDQNIKKCIEITD